MNSESTDMAARRGPLPTDGTPGRDGASADEPPAEDRRPWYRHGWFWLVMIPPAWGVCAGLTLLYLAVSTPNPMVVDDYSRIGRHTEARMERDREAARLGLSGEVVIDAPRTEADRRQVRVMLDTGQGAVPPTLLLSLLHPTRDALDRTLTLHYDGDGWATLVEDFAPSRYYVQIEPPGREWRLKGELGTRGASVRLAPPTDAHMVVDTATPGADGTAR